jgi:hypothetical protein
MAYVGLTSAEIGPGITKQIKNMIGIKYFEVLMFLLSAEFRVSIYIQPHFKDVILSKIVPLVNQRGLTSQKTCN